MAKTRAKWTLGDVHCSSLDRTVVTQLQFQLHSWHSTFGLSSNLSEINIGTSRSKFQSRGVRNKNFCLMLYETKFGDYPLINLKQPGVLCSLAFLYCRLEKYLPKFVFGF